MRPKDDSPRRDTSYGERPRKWVLETRADKARRTRPLLPSSERQVMTIDEGPLRAILSKFTYRPGWRFSIRAGLLRIDATVINADDPTGTIEVLQESGIPYGMNPSFS